MLQQRDTDMQDHMLNWMTSSLFWIKPLVYNFVESTFTYMEVFPLTAPLHAMTHGLMK